MESPISTHHSVNASVTSSGQLLPLFFRSVSSGNGNLFGPFLWQLRMRPGRIYEKKAWSGTRKCLHEGKSRHGASITHAETTARRYVVLALQTF